jgi:ABC-type uncharacterized transport system permease subunit
MPKRGLLFLFSLAVVAAMLAVADWLLATRQADSFDGLFLFLSSLLLAFVFSLFIRFLIRDAMRESSTAKAKRTPSSPVEPVQREYEKVAH